MVHAGRIVQIKGDNDVTSLKGAIDSPKTAAMRLRDRNASVPLGQARRIEPIAQKNGDPGRAPAAIASTLVGMKLPACPVPSHFVIIEIGKRGFGLLNSNAVNVRWDS